MSATGAQECRWRVNGADVADCTSLLGGAGMGAIERVRDRVLLAADEPRGLAVYRTFEDRPATGGSG